MNSDIVLNPKVKLLLGTAKVDITPLKPVPLAGFAHRSGNFAGVAERIYAKIWYFRSSSETGKTIDAIFVQGDLLYWGSECIDIMTSSISKEYGISPEAIIFHGSHSHSGPQTDTRPLPLGAKADSEYLNWMIKQILETVEKASKNIEEVRVSRGYGNCDIGINRRGKINGKIQMVPNPDGPVDPEVIVLKFTTLKGRIKGVMVHYTCHATTTDSKMVSSEYCGVAMEQIAESLGEDTMVSFLQGCCGDIRPALIRDGYFYRGDNNQVKSLAEKLSHVVMGIMNHPMTTLESSNLKAFKKTVMLPLSHVPTLNDLNQLQLGEENYLIEWKDMLLKNPDLLKDYVPLTLSYLEITKELAFLGLGAEAVVNYGLYIKKITNGKLLPLGYTNGMIGYLPSAQQLTEGGYEAWESYFYYGFPAPFDEKVQKLVEDAVQDILLMLCHN